MTERSEISNPGQSQELILPSQAVERDPTFFENRPQNWILRVKKADGTIEELVGVDWEVVSPFGAVRSAVVTDEGGMPLFDRPKYEETPSVNVVAWGIDKKGKVRVSLISQPRPHSDHPTDLTNTKTLTFAQIPMGFQDKLIGKDQLAAYESAKDAAIRETEEETGAGVILNITQPNYPFQNPNPTFVGTWSELVFVEVDLEKVDQLKADRNEPIFRAEYITVQQLWSEIRAGETEYGISRMCTSNAAFVIWLSNLGKLYRESKDRAFSK